MRGRGYGHEPSFYWEDGFVNFGHGGVDFGSKQYVSGISFNDG